MGSLILSTAARLHVALMLLFSVFLLARGHNEPGGGFLGGLIAAIGFVVYAIAEGPAAVRGAIRVEPRKLAFVGVALTLVAALPGPLAGEPFLTGLWGSFAGVKVGTPLLFDTGVYLAVLGGVLALILALEED